MKKKHRQQRHSPSFSGAGLSWEEANMLIRTLQYTHSFAAMHHDASLSDEAKDHAQMLANKLGTTLKWDEGPRVA